MEDNFLGLLTLDVTPGKLIVRKQSKQELRDEGFTKQKSITTKDVADFLIKIPELEKVATRLYPITSISRNMSTSRRMGKVMSLRRRKRTVMIIYIGLQPSEH